MKIVISSGHGKKVSGAIGPKPWGLDEHAEAVRVVNKTAEYLHRAGVDCTTFEDTISTTQNENLNRIVDFHNSKTRDLDVSVHFNANVSTSKPMGTECLYVTQLDLATEVAAALSTAGDLIDRGPKKRTDLFFLNNTEEPAILIEVCFVDSQADVDLYKKHFDAICLAIAETIGEKSIKPQPPEPPSGALLHVTGTCSWFGGPDDTGVSASEGLAFLYELEDAPHLFLSEQPAGTSGLARRLDPDTNYVACRWDYSVTPKEMLRDQTRKALVKAKGHVLLCYPADWGPHEDTHRVCDLSPAAMEALDVTTDDEVEVIYPAPQTE